MDHAIAYPRIPCMGPIGRDGKFFPQSLIRIQGIVPEASFRINLHCGPIPFAQDVALQMHVDALNSYVCLNSASNKEWNKEIRRSVGSFNKPGEKFEIVVLCEFDHYKIIINGNKLCNFRHRICYDKISHLSISGDVSITQISFELANEHVLQRLSSSGLFSSPANDHQLVEPNSIDSDPPSPSYETVLNGTENAKPYPVQPMHANYVAAYRAHQVQKNATGEVGSVSATVKPNKCKIILKRMCTVFGVLLVIGSLKLLIGRIYSHTKNLNNN